jgi:predicted permease
MTPNLRWFRRLTSLVRANRLERDLNDELLFHIEARTRDNIARGMTADEARLAAVRQFGNRTLMAERMRDADVNRWIDAGMRNLRYAARTLRRSPGFTTVVVLSMALGIGANTAVFSLLNAVVLKTLPVTNPEELVVLEARVKGPAGERTALDWHRDYRNFQANAGREIELFATSSTSAVTTLNDQVEQVTVGLVSGNYYSVLGGVKPVIGRLLDRADDDEKDARAVTVLEYDFWQRRFGGDPNVLNRQIVLNGTSFAIVGVVPRGFAGTTVGESVSLTITFQAERRLEHGESFRTIGGRLRPGVSRQQAASVLTSLFQAAPQHRNHVIVVKDNSRGEFYDRERFEKPLYVLMGAVLLVLVIAAANVASLMLARGAARRREISIRLALGAGRGGIVAQLLTESVMIALMGAAAGIAFAYFAVDGLLAVLYAGTAAPPLAVGPDANVLTFTACTALLTGLLFGLFPAFQARSSALNPTLKDGSGIVGRRPRLIARRTLVVAQIALSLLLLSGATMFTRSLANLRALDTGYDRRGILLASFEPDGRYTNEQRHQIQRELLERVRSLPGVEAAGVASTSVLRPGEYSVSLEIQGQTTPCRSSMTIASPGYLETMRMRLVAGRAFTAADNQPGAPHAVIVNQEIAKRCFGARNPIGQRVKAGFGVDAEIVGVVADAKYRNLREAALPMYYIPPRSLHPRGLELHARTSFDPRAAVEPIRRALRDVDPAVPLTHVRTLEDQSEQSVVQDRLLAVVSSAFGIGALALAAIGLYGVLAFMVARRTNEIGLRLALGARRLQIVRLILADSSSLLIAGCALGVFGALVGQRLIQSLLFGVSPSDYWSLLGAAAVLGAVGVFASLIPAGRATRINPIAALRHE